MLWRPTRRWWIHSSIFTVNCLDNCEIKITVMFNTVTLTFGPIQFKCFIKEVVFQVHNKSLISTFNVFCKLQKLCIILHFPKVIGSLCTNLWIRVKRFRDFVLKNKRKKYQKLLNIEYDTTDRLNKFKTSTQNIFANQVFFYENCNHICLSRLTHEKI